MLRVFRPVSQSFRLTTRPPLASAIPAFSAAAQLRAARYASTKSYTEDHEWVSYDSSTKIGVVGITEYAQKALGDVVFVELPVQGSEVSKHDQIGAVESVKAASDIFAPLSGTIESINESLGDQPALLNRSPEDQGWLCKIKITNEDEIKGLMNAEAYQAHCEGKE